MFLASDNGLGCSDKVMAAIVAANGGARLAYGRDDETAAIERRLADLFGHEVAVFMVATGSAANGLALSLLADPWGVILCHEASHVMEDECNGPEFFTGGTKLHGIRGPGAKITPAGLEAGFARWPTRVPHNPPVQALSLTQSTEMGLVYSVDEVTTLTRFARDRGLKVHMDGARFANAVAHLGCTPAEITWKAGIDILSFGTTKGGTLACEAIVCFDPERARSMVRRRMRGGHLLSKHRFFAAQMQAFLDDGHWLTLAAHANACASRLATGLASVPGITVPFEPQANGVFPILPVRIEAALKQAGAVFYPWPPLSLPDNVRVGEGETMVRMVTSFATDPADIDRVISVARVAA